MVFQADGKDSQGVHSIIQMAEYAKTCQVSSHIILGYTLQATYIIKIGFGKRSTRSKLPKEDVVRTDLDPIPFDWYEHGPRLRSRREATCGDESTQYVLFVLDTSGSIGSSNFERMKRVLALLPGLFCRQVKFAAITFDSYVSIEFCFDCFESTYNGRSSTKIAIENILYRGGSTYTGATA